MVKPIVPCILHDKEDENLHSNFPRRGERHAVLNTKESGDRVEKPDQGQLGSEVAEEDSPSTVPLLLEGGHLLSLNLLLVQYWNLVYNHEGYTAAEVDEFMYDEGHGASRKRIILHV